MRKKEKRRKCKKCGKTLSIYNEGKNCYAHRPGFMNYAFVPITGCTSFDPVEQHSRKVMGYAPGDEGYNEIAFTKIHI